MLLFTQGSPLPVPHLQVIPGVNPQMALVKVVYDELTELMGSAGAKDLQPGKPQIVLMAGLQVKLVG